MENAPFITRPMSIALDAVRGLAAFAVLFGHAMQITVYKGYFPYWFVLQHNAVLIFFVLSGLVIANSARKASSSLTDYAIARAARILPVALPAILFSVGVEWYVTSGQMHGLAPWQWLRNTLFSALFLSESFGTGLPGNPPFWSLCYEVWFYVLFGAAFYLRGRARLICVPLLAALAGPNILLLLPAWLAGAWVARTDLWRRLSRPLAWLLALMGLAAIPLAVPVAQKLATALKAFVPWTLRYSEFAVTDWIVAVAVAVCFVAMRRLISAEGRLLTACQRPIRYFAGMSFSLYLLHWPVVTLLHQWGVDPMAGNVGMAAYLAMIVAICAVFAHFTEHKRDIVRGWLERLARPKLAQRAAPAAA
jgi:peptidoglycan/LPS O-acetylase OafA/YrhL